MFHPLNDFIKSLSGGLLAALSTVMLLTVAYGKGGDVTISFTSNFGMSEWLMDVLILVFCLIIGLLALFNVGGKKCQKKSR